MFTGKNIDLPGHFQLVYSEKDIAGANAKIGKLVTDWAKEVWARSHTDIVTIPVLRGGIFFFADLVREIEHSVELSPTFSQSYVANSPQKEMRVDIDGVPVRGRSVLLIDDICDSGKTLAEMSQRLKANGAHEVRSAVLVKRILDTPTFNPDWVGFDYKGLEWLVGYGMDDNNRWRNLYSIYAIKKV